MVVSEVHSWKTPTPRALMGGSVIEVNERQPRKTQQPKVVMVFGIVIEAREAQL